MFEITIKEIKTVTKLVGGDFRLIAEKEVARDPIFLTGSLSDHQPTTRIENVYGYAPMIEKPVEVEIEILKQSVETLDLAAVIKAINKL